jgi:hypothetical protein
MAVCNGLRRRRRAAPAFLFKQRDEIKPLVVDPSIEGHAPPYGDLPVRGRESPRAAGQTTTRAGFDESSRRRSLVQMPLWTARPTTAKRLLGTDKRSKLSDCRDAAPKCDRAQSTCPAPSVIGRSEMPHSDAIRADLPYGSKQSPALARQRRASSSPVRRGRSLFVMVLAAI